MLIHWIWLATRPSMNEREKLAVLEHFQDAEAVYYAEPEMFREIEDLTEKGMEALKDRNLHPAGEILRQCMDKNIRICTFHDAAYPGRLKNISDPPLVLYYKGRLPDMDGAPVITIVGTRKATPYGVKTAGKLGGQIARCGAVVVCGMAEGIDGAGAAGALSADGMVVGVLGSGVDLVYPACNRSLFADVERYGCLMSEFPPGTPPFGWNFPKRNRIMSGLANGVLVVEAPEKSGALITARLAAEQGRDVFVAPGNLDMPSCVGSNALLREGAISVGSGWDVVSEYLSLYPDVIRRDSSKISPHLENIPMKVADKPRSLTKNRNSDRKKEKIIIDNWEKPPYSDIHNASENLTENERRIIALLQNGELLVDDVIAQAGLPASTVLSTLTILQVRGFIEKRPGNRAALK